MIKKLWLFVFILLIPVLLLECRSPVFESRWAAVPMMIDGQNTDWEVFPLYKLESLNVSLGLCNDAEYLYLLLHFEDPMFAMRVRSAGIALEFARQNKRETIFELRYMGSDTSGAISGLRDSFWQSLNPDQRARFINHQAKMNSMITVLKNGSSVQVSADSSHELSAARIEHQGFFGYELKLPIQGDDKPYSLDLGLGESCFIGIRFTSQKADQKPGMMDQTADMPGERGIMQGPSVHGRSGQWANEKSIENRDIWFRVILATEE
jgi:hypothetical protein